MSAKQLLFLTVVWFYGVNSDEFHESLLLRPLEDGSLFAEFKFNVITRYSSLSSTFYDLFPKSIGELFIRLPIWQFDLTLTRGRWNYENWGSFHSNIAPYGAELRTVFYDNQTDADDNITFNNEYLILQQILSGLYCASINEIDIQIMNQTCYQFIPSELSWLNSISSHHWLYYYGILPKENICTENLTPWSNLLPCRRNNGLSKLLNPSSLFSAKYQSMQIHVEPAMNKKQNKFMKITQLFQVVFDMNFDPKSIIDRIKKPKIFNIQQLFDITDQHIPYLNGCPVADSSLIIFDINQWVYNSMPKWNLIKNNNDNAPIKPLPDVIHNNNNNNGHLWMYSLSTTSNKLKTIQFEWSLKMFPFNRIPKYINNNIDISNINYLKTEKYLTEYNLISGKLRINIMNNHPTKSIRFSYFDPLPHFLKLYFHTMDMRIDGVKIDPFEDLEYFNIEFTSHHSEVVRIRNEDPICMEWIITLKSNSKLTFTMDIDKKFQHFESYPPDYNRGFDIANSIIRILDEEFDLIDYNNLFIFGDKKHKKEYKKNEMIIINDTNYRKTSQIIYLPQLLVVLPYPDMSMVFNVIAFSSTLFAFFFGTAFNNLYRDIDDLDKRNIHLIRDKLKSLFVYIWKKCPCKKKKQSVDNDNIDNKSDS